VYNGANYLRQAIDSALAQTYPHTEVIVVDDGSTDGGRTHEIALSYGSRIRYFEKSNGGVATALNLGVREMRGEFFSWLSHDDVYYPEKIARQMEYWQEIADDRAILFSGSHIIDDRSRITGTAPIHAFALTNSIVAVLGTYVGGCSMLIPKSAFEEAGLFNERLRNSQDNELWLRMVMKEYRLRYMPDVLIQSRSHSEQGTRTDSVRHAEEARAFYALALKSIGLRHRIENARPLFRILFMKRFPSVARELFWLLRRDRSSLYAAGSMGAGAFDFVRAALANRLAAVPGLRGVLRAVRSGASGTPRTSGTSDRGARKRQVHVLLVPSWYPTPDRPWSGIFIENQALALARAGARVGVVFVEQRSVRALSLSRLRESHFQTVCSANQDVTVLRMKAWNTFAQTRLGAKLWVALSGRLVKAYVDRFGIPDVLHAHVALWAGTVGIRMRRALGRPCVVTEHSSQILRGDVDSAERREAARVYREADAVLAVSQGLLAAVGSLARVQLGGVVPETVDFEFFTLPPVPRHRTPFTFVSVSNLVMGKRVDILIRAFARALRACPAIRLVIVGTGADAPGLQRLARDCGVEPHVEFTGGLPPDGVRERLWSANAMVLSSAFETFGMVLVEALATGIPVIATRCGGPDEIVEPGLGLLVERDDEEGLANAMVVTTERSYSETALRERALARFGLGSVAEQLLRVYDAVIQR
jgi:glycosyltransferase involved in cell wall biosynthesis